MQAKILGLQTKSIRLHEITSEVGAILEEGKASEPFVGTSLQKRAESLGANIESCYNRLHNEMSSILMRESRARPSEIAKRLKALEAEQVTKAEELEAERQKVVGLIQRAHVRFSEAQAL